MKKYIFLLLICGVSIFQSYATDFQYNGIWYSVLDEEAGTCSTKNGKDYIGTDNKHHCIAGNDVWGDIEIPECAVFNDKSYTVVRIGLYGFYKCGVTSIKIPDTVKEIGSSAFADCTSLYSASIGSSVETMGSGVFDGCFELNSVNIPSLLECIEEQTFRDCHNLKIINVPSSVKRIEKEAFMRCFRLKLITLPNSLSYMGDDAFNGCGFYSINIPRGISYLAKYVFSNCESLQEISIPDNIKRIEDNAFAGCSELKKVSISSSVTSIGSKAFVNCIGLKSIALPESVTVLPDGLFSGCTQLQTVKLPTILTSIGREAFYDCTNLTYIDIPEGVVSIGESAFEYCTSLLSVILPKSIKEVESNAFSSTLKLAFPSSISKVYCKEYAIEYPADNSVIQEGWIYNSDRTIIYFAPCSIKGEIVIPDNTVEIARAAFARCEKIKSIILPSSLFQIGDNSFEKCIEVEKLQIQDGIQKIGDYAFASCIKLLGFEIPNTVSNIGSYAFQNCNKLNRVSIPQNINSIGVGAFYSTNLIEVRYPSSNPIECSELVFSKAAYSSALLRIGYDKDKKYRKISPWKNFRNIQEIINRINELSLSIQRWEGILGEKFQIAATISPVDASIKKLSWSSNDENVAVVDESGTVTAVGVGKSVITAAATDGSGVTATCEITVNPVLVESISLTPAEWNGIEGETFQITAVVLPENATYKTLEWSSSNELVATVDNSGLVSVLKEGSCVITAKTTDGSEISAECIVTSTSGIDDIFSDADERFDIYNMQGVVIKKYCNRDGLKMLSSGIYILRQGRETRKLIIR